MADAFSTDGFSTELGGVSTELSQINTLADGMARTLTRAFRSAISDGKSLNSVLGDIVLSFSNLALKAALQPVGSLISGFIGNLFSATGPASLGTVQPFAKGGVIAAPSYFPLGAGTGLAGEAGPEAIMPLTRGSDGRLGIAGGGGGVTVNFNVTAQDAKSFAASEAELSAMLLRAVRRGTRAS
jgi:phage-related minor tail protein